MAFPGYCRTPQNERCFFMQVTVILDKTEDMCSIAFNGPHRQKITVQAISSALVSYTIIPLKTGELPLQLTAIASNFMGQDAVRKNLHVVVNMFCFSHKLLISLICCVL